jgi:hypothetical protein
VTAFELWGAIELQQAANVPQEAVKASNHFWILCGLSYDIIDGYRNLAT